jgi:hypothetical protein
MKVDVTYDALLRALIEAIRNERDPGKALMSVLSRLMAETRQQDRIANGVGQMKKKRATPRWAKPAGTANATPREARPAAKPAAAPADDQVGHGPQGERHGSGHQKPLKVADGQAFDRAQVHAKGEADC